MSHTSNLAQFLMVRIVVCLSDLILCFFFLFLYHSFFSPFADFLSTYEVVLTNTSEIPMTYQLKVPRSKEKEECEGEREFNIKPKSGVLPPNCNQAIQVRLG